MVIEAIGRNPFDINRLRNWVPNGPSEQPTEKTARERRKRKIRAESRSQQPRPEYCDINGL